MGPDPRWVDQISSTQAQAYTDSSDPSVVYVQQPQNTFSNVSNMIILERINNLQGQTYTVKRLNPKIRISKIDLSSHNNKIKIKVNRTKISRTDLNNHHSRFKIKVNRTKIKIKEAKIKAISIPLDHKSIRVHNNQIKINKVHFKVKV